MSATCGKPSVRRRWRAAFGGKPASGSSPVDLAVGEPARAAAAERERAVLRRAHEHEADVRVLAERRDQVRVPLADLLEREPVRALHQVDEAEVARSRAR